MSKKMRDSSLYTKNRIAKPVIEGIAIYTTDSEAIRNVTVKNANNGGSEVKVKFRSTDKSYSFDSPLSSALIIGTLMQTGSVGSQISEWRKTNNLKEVA